MVRWSLLSMSKRAGTALLAVTATFSHATDCSLDGKIDQRTQGELYRELDNGCRTVYLSSPGGDVAVAMEIGRRLRRSEVGVVVPRDSTCESACVLLYAAGVTRTPYGEVRIHRPFHTSPAASLTQEQARYDTLSQVIRSYLRQMNVRESLFDAMLRVPPEESRPLLLEEMYDFGLGLTDPVYAEFRDSRAAAAAGMSKEWFLLKKKRTAELCSGGIYDEAVPSTQSEARVACWRRNFPEYVK